MVKTARLRPDLVKIFKMAPRRHFEDQDPPGGQNGQNSQKTSQLRPRGQNGQNNCNPNTRAGQNSPDSIAAARARARMQPSTETPSSA